LRARLEQANRRVTDSERLVGGWRDVTESEQSAGRDVSVARDLLKTFQTGLEAALNDKEGVEKALAQRLLDLFEGVRGRLPANDQELRDWLASPEGKPRRRSNQPVFPLRRIKAGYKLAARQIASCRTSWELACWP
jgi:hypothetical protein